VDKIGAVGSPPREIIKVRCRHCGALDDEAARYCSNCGKEM